MTDIVAQIKRRIDGTKERINRSGQVYYTSRDAEVDRLAIAEITNLCEMNSSLLAANRDCMLRWEVLKSDFDRLRAALLKADRYLALGSPDLAANVVRLAIKGKADGHAARTEAKRIGTGGDE